MTTTYQLYKEIANRVISGELGISEAREATRALDTLIRALEQTNSHQPSNKDEIGNLKRRSSGSGAALSQEQPKNK
jgi:hypothetical protein